MNEDFFLFPWRWHPVLTGLFFFMMTVGAVQLLSRIFDGEWLRTRWVTFWLGDPMLALAGIFMGIVIGQHTADRGFQNEWWLQLLLLGIGLFFFVILELFHVFVDGGPEYKKVAVRPGQLWHTIFAGLVFYEILWGIITTVRDGRPSWAFVIAVAFLAVYLDTMLYDNLYNPKRKEPVTLDNR